MIRFILRRKFRDAISGCSYDNQLFSVDIQVPILEGELRRGGYGESGYEVVELVGAEVVDPHRVSNQEVDAEVTRLRAAMTLAECQYMGCGGNLSPSETVESMRKILQQALSEYTK